MAGDLDDDPGQLAAALVARLTLSEKVSQLQNHAPAVPRLGIPAYDWWSESLHGVARNGRATVFPQAIGLGASFDEDLVGRVARAIADEARAKFAARISADGDTGRYQGLTFFAPNVNIFRDPRWGRGQETYGEDPFLTGRLAVAYVRGLQGDDPRFLKVAAVAKHFAAHSGPELLRQRFDTRVQARDLADTYLPQFEAVVREGRVAGIMAAYNRLNGVPCVANSALLEKLLRQQWGFGGFVVGDCGAVEGVAESHHAAAGPVQAAALSLRAGTDLDCGSTYQHLDAALGVGLVTEKEIDQAAARLFEVRFRLGLLGGTGRSVPPAVASPTELAGQVDRLVAAHRGLAREAAQKSLVLLTNNGVLPVGPGVRRIAVVGPLGDDVEVLLGNYHGEPTAPVTVLAGLRAAARARGIAVEHARGVTLSGRSVAGLGRAAALARDADLIVAVLGLSPLLEGEEGDPDGRNPAGDRRDLGLPGAQPDLLKALLGTGKPTVVVLTGGGAIALPQDAGTPDAVLMAWYPGEQGGHAVADILFGDVAPSGRLPVTFYRSVEDLPPFADYAMAGRTYRYFAGKPLFAFGHGLGYAPVVYRQVTVEVGPTPSSPSFSGELAPVHLHAIIENRGRAAVEEVVQIYARPRPAIAGDAVRSLIAFRRIAVAPDQPRAVDFELPRRLFVRVDGRGSRRPVSGPWDLLLGDVTVTVDLPP